MNLARLIPRAPGWEVDWEALVQAFPSLTALFQCPQDATYHAEGDVGTHTQMVCRELAALPAWRQRDDDERCAVFLGALLHDIGKPSCTRHEEDGRISSRGHSRRGAIEARRLLWERGLPLALREQICALILHHQAPFFLLERPDSARLALEISCLVKPSLLALVAEADGRGRRCADQERILECVALSRAYWEEQTCLEAPFPFPTDHTRVAYFRDPTRSPSHEIYDSGAVEVVVMSGLPGAGKDHWLGENLPDWAQVSLDALRKEMGVDPAGTQGAVIQRARELARQHLRAATPFVWNATNLSRELRKQVLGLLADYRARVRIVYVEAPHQRHRTQNLQRAHPVPQRVLERLLSRWEVPTMTEAHRVDWVVS